MLENRASGKHVSKNCLLGKHASENRALGKCTSENHASGNCMTSESVFLSFRRFKLAVWYGIYMRVRNIGRF